MAKLTQNLTGVLKHLRHVNVEEGEQIELEIVFQKMIEVDSIFWYKDNEIIEEDDDRIIKLSADNMHLLGILRSQTTDTGVYYVVGRTKDGLVSSFANVQVTPANRSKFKDCQQLPIIEELPSDIGAFENEELRVVCKANFDIHTSIHWHKNGISVTDDSNFVADDYGVQYIGLRGIVTTADTGEYTLRLLNEDTNCEESLTFNVTITPKNPRHCAPVVKLERPLLPVVACVGSQLVFDCCFDLKDSTYLYVVWHVGHYRIERTNSKFNVICKGGEYLLYIKELQPDMGGTVVCELRKAFPNQKTVHVGSCTAALTIVPPTVVEKEHKNNPPRKRIYNTASKQTFDSPPKSSINGSGVCDGNDFLDISCSRLDDCVYYLYASKGNREVNILFQEKFLTNRVLITWEESLFPRKCWFAIEVGLNDGSHVEAGVSSEPTVGAVKPPNDTIMKIRVRSAPALNNATQSMSLVPPQDAVLQPLKSDEVRTMEKFEEHYTVTGELLGYGAFGSVVLARDNQGKHYAAKLIKTLTQKDREKTRREYEMMKLVHHARLIQLAEGFHDTKTFVIVMEYLWGGELFDRIVQEEHIVEEDVVHYVRQICEALAYLHKCNIVHLDIKPENIICLSPNTCQVKLIDFGIATVLEGRTVRALYGTRDYMAPEVLNFEPLTSASDMWSAGVVTYTLLAGQMPFPADTWGETSALITSASYNYRDVVFRDISDLAKNFIDKLLVLNTAVRMTATQALQHEWLKTGPPKTTAHMKQTRKNMKTYLVAYRAKWQRAGHVMIAAQRFRASAAASSVRSQSATEPSTATK